ncbi:MAG: glycine C-acetyltransferase [Paracoccaceae bacterium]|nr:glycine C-acetyltransferase [Paracoccaceae bacterium]
MSDFLNGIETELGELDAAGLLKREREIVSPQGAHVRVGSGDFINLCANNYLGLADDSRLVAAARGALDSHGLGMASVRFICGTGDLHRALEAAVAAYLGMEDAILYAACFDANGGLFEPLLGAEDAVVSDALNHASIIDGIRLCKAQRFRYRNADMDDLETQLRAARKAGARRVMIATDGVFSMDGYFAPLAEIRALAERYEAVVMVDDCHATGFVGPAGRGTPARAGVPADIVTGTFGKALGGSIGGFTAGPRPVVEMLRQRSRPYLFSNALPPAVCAAAIEALKIAEAGDDLRARLDDNAAHWRAGLETLGFEVLPGEHPIIPVMTGEATAAQAMAARLFELGVYVAGFFYPVVPKGQARIRTQMSAALNRADLDLALDAFAVAGRETGVLA